jgi:hypothetical protein
MQTDFFPNKAKLLPFPNSIGQRNINAKVPSKSKSQAWQFIILPARMTAPCKLLF